MIRPTTASLFITAALTGAAIAQPAPSPTPAEADQPSTTAKADALPTDGAPTDADAPDAPAPAPTAATDAPARWSDRVTMSGLVDGYFAVPFQGELRDPSGVRVFDGGNGSFTLAYAELAVAVAAEPAGFRVDLGFGPVADLTSLETSTSGTPPVTVTGPSEIGKHVQQAYASFKLPGTRSIVVDAGKFVTTTGAEVIEAKDNWLYSRSILFGFAIPFTHTGVRITAAIDERLSVQAMVVNGWDVSFDNNDAKTFGGSVLYADADAGLTGAANVLVGKEAADVRILADVVVGKRVTDKLSLNLNADFGKEGDARWYGAAVMARLAAADQLNLALRAEHFQDPDGVRTAVMGGTSITEITAGLGIPVGGNAEVRLEGRIDLAADDIYDGGTSATQGTAQAAALAWF